MLPAQAVTFIVFSLFLEFSDSSLRIMSLKQTFLAYFLLRGWYFKEDLSIYHKRTRMRFC